MWPISSLVHLSVLEDAKQAQLHKKPIGLYSGHRVLIQTELGWLKSWWIHYMGGISIQLSSRSKIGAATDFPGQAGLVFLWSCKLDPSPAKDKQALTVTLANSSTCNVGKPLIKQLRLVQPKWWQPQPIVPMRRHNLWTVPLKKTHYLLHNTIHDASSWMLLFQMALGPSQLLGKKGTTNGIDILVRK